MAEALGTVEEQPAETMPEPGDDASFEESMAFELAGEGEPESGAEGEAEGERTAQAEASGEQQADEGEEAGGKETQDEESVSLTAPEDWSAEDREVFASQPRPAQEFMLRRHGDMLADYTRKTQEVAVQRRAFEPVVKRLKDTGYTDTEAAGVVERALAFNVQLQREPTATLNALADRLGVTQPGPREKSLAEDDESYLQDPELENLRREVESLKTGIEAKDREREYRTAAEAAAGMQVQIDAMRAEKDASGKLLYPHFDELEAEMTNICRAARLDGRNLDIKELYEQASWLVPEIREKRLMMQSEAERKKKESERAAKAKAAKGAALRVTGNNPPGAVPAENEDEDLETTLKAEARESGFL